MWFLFFYSFVGLCIAFLFGFTKLLSRCAFRDEDGDVSTEVGYDEDPAGIVRKPTVTHYCQEDLEKPHVGIEKPMH